jgi:hypothetical protein
MSRYRSILAGGALISALLLVSGAWAQEQLPWERNDPYAAQPPSSGWPSSDGYRTNDAYRHNDANRSGSGYQSARPNDPYAPPPSGPAQGSGQDRYGGSYQSQQGYSGPSAGYGSPYQAPSGRYGEPYDRNYGEPGPRGAYGYGPQRPYEDRTYSQNEIIDAGHRVFGSVSRGLASAVEYAFQQAGRPNGYILGQDAGGAFIAGLRYGEGMLYTKDAGQHRVYWQGPSLGYDFGGEGSKTMVLVYNLRDPSDIYNRFGGVEGSAYLVGGVSVQFQKHGDVVLAPIRSGVGVRLGANVGYLKYTRTPTWNPF